MVKAEEDARLRLEQAGVQFSEADVDEFRKAAEVYYTYDEFKNWTPAGS